MIDKRGQRFGRLVVLDRVPPRRGDLTVRWRCRCDCGRVAVVKSYLLGRDTKSCGCFRRDVGATKNLSHGLTTESNKRPEYGVWYSARRRCHDPRSESFPLYGGRGIVMCEAWRTSVEAFYRDMGPRPTNRHMLERQNNDGPYAPGNCVWALPKVQQRNKRNNHPLTYREETLPLSAWCERFHLDHATLYLRLQRGWTVDQALTTPTTARKAKVLKDGTSRTHHAAPRKDRSSASNV